MKKITKIAVLGCGSKTALLIAGMLMRLTGDFRLTVHVRNVFSVESARKRLTTAMQSNPDPRVSFEVTTAAQVAPDTELVLVSIGKGGDSGATSPAEVRAGYCAQLGPEAIVLEHSAEFPEQLSCATPDARVGVFHFLYPADLMGLIEIGLSGYDEHARERVGEFFEAAGFYPLIQERWKAGFLSNRFQLKLLEAISRVLEKTPNITEEVAAKIDTAISVVAVQLYRALRQSPDGTGVFDRVAALRDQYLANTPDYAPLWRAFECTWREVQEFWSERTVAWALLTGPALRCIRPGFLKFIDMENLAPFLALIGQICPDGDDDVLWRLLSQGRPGVKAPFAVFSVQWIDGGFYPRGEFEKHQAMVEAERRFLQRHRLLQSLMTRERALLVNAGQ